MKKIINGFKNYHPSKPVMLLYLLIPLCFAITSTKCIDNDFWFIINIGRYITNHGLFYIDPFTVHEGLHVVVQQWPVDLLFYHIYNIFGEIGIWLLILLLFIIIMYLIYKICILISERLSLSIMMTTIISFLFVLY